MDAILEILNKWNELRYEEDFIDRFNYQYTPYLFALSALLITSKTYMGTGIVCWTPAEFRKGWKEYAQDYCLIENTYYLPIHDPHMPDILEREQAKLPYYQWVQFVLVLLGFLFYLPHVLWRSINWWSGMQVRAVVKSASTLPKADVDERKKEVKKIAGHILRANNRDSSGWLINSGWVSLTYLFLKLNFILNIALQIVILHLFLGFNWGDLLQLRLNFKSDWMSNGLFPRSTMCDFDVRTKGNIQRYSVQCVLSLNMFNEKIFLVLFYWLLILFFMTVGNAVNWFLHLSSKASRVAFAERMLRASGYSQPGSYKSQPISLHLSGSSSEKEPLKQTEDLKIEDYSNSYYEFAKLNVDVYVLLRLIASNAGDVVCSDVVGELFQQHMAEQRKSQGNH